MKFTTSTLAAHLSSFATMAMALTNLGPVAATTTESCVRHDIERWVQYGEGWPSPDDYQGYFTPVDRQKWANDGLWFWWNNREDIDVKICNDMDGTTVYQGPIRPPCCTNRVSRTQPHTAIRSIEEGWYVVRGDCNCHPPALSHFIEGPQNEKFPRSSNNRCYTNVGTVALGAEGVDKCASRCLVCSHTNCQNESYGSFTGCGGFSVYDNWRNRAQCWFHPPNMPEDCVREPVSGNPTPTVESYDLATDNADIN